LRKGDTVTIETLLHAALIRSANDAAVALAESAGGSEEKFVDLMNRRAVDLGLYNTRFINQTVCQDQDSTSLPMIWQRS